MKRDGKNKFHLFFFSGFLSGMLFFKKKKYTFAQNDDAGGITCVLNFENNKIKN